MHINWQSREINLKIVYYGPALSGKTTNLEQIHARIDPRRRSDLVSLKTQGDRTLFFDFLQLELGRIGSLTPKIQLYTVPGQSYYEASRKLVLRGADGVVFVVDSAAERLTANVQAFQDMRAHLASFDTPLNDVPVIVQFNKQDLPTALPPHVLRMLLHTDSLPVLTASAKCGDGVFTTLKAITRGVMAYVQREVA
ncbi:MAG: gliding-motility protein MglA [Chloroflexi bacterium]|jgi:signal recognition particle receptor subunit beta|nr:ADP-ribosylation factor-like protein [Anaerolineaceae bacterium]NMB88358.1 gliding-motility protein MglA [Chloroflexota bacterium]